jgi:hypothetical protein
MKNNKGLSTIVATLLIILLVLVAVGIVWVVVRNVVRNGSNQVDINTMCIEAQVSATKVNETSPALFNVTLERTGGNTEIGGVKLVFTNANETSNFIQDVPGDMPALSVKTVAVLVPSTNVANPDLVSVVVYFTDDTGNEQLCQATTPFEF